MDHEVLETGLLVDLSKILDAVSLVKAPFEFAANEFTYYYAPLFKNSSIINNIPCYILNDLSEFITLELTIPNDRFLSKSNLINLTSYCYTYQNQLVFGSTDASVQFFKRKPKAGDVLKFCITSSITIGEAYRKNGYKICRIDPIFLAEGTYNFLLRVGLVDGQFYPSSLLRKAKLSLNKSTLTNLLPYKFLDIVATLPLVLGSKLSFGNQELLNKLLGTYNDTINDFINKGYTQIPTYLFSSNVPDPVVNYAFQSFYDDITVQPFVNNQANGTGEGYFNTAPIDLSQYAGKSITVIACNQNAFQFALVSNIQIYNNETLTFIPNTSYNTSPTIPPITDKNYPFPYTTQGDAQLYPLVNVKTFDITTTFLNLGYTKINIGERCNYNQINFNHSNYYLVPRFQVFISN